MAKATAKKAVKRAAVKAPARKLAVPKVAAKAPKKVAVVKTAKTFRKPEPKQIVQKTKAVTPSPRVKADTTQDTKPATPSARATPFALPAAKAAVKPAALPAPVARTTQNAGALRVDIPPTSGFVLLVDGHFKSQFETMKSAKAVGAELLGRFPMLRIEIYDATTKTRLPL